MRNAHFVFCFAALFCGLNCQYLATEPVPAYESEGTSTLQRSYYSTGELRREFYLDEDSLMTKIYREYTPDGKMNRAIEYLTGRPHGAYVTFYPSGDTASLHYYRHGLPEGPFYWRYPNGMIRREGDKRNGHDHGLVREWYGNGAPKSVINYHYGKKYQGSYWYFPDGGIRRFAYFGRLGQNCFQINFDGEGAVKKMEGQPIADLKLAADDFKRQFSLVFVSACPSESDCKFSLWKEIDGNKQKLKIRQEENAYHWSEPILGMHTFYYEIQATFTLAGQDSVRFFRQRIKISPGKKIDYAITSATS